jgi:hypothetical protein
MNRSLGFLLSTVCAGIIGLYYFMREYDTKLKFILKQVKDLEKSTEHVSPIF